MRFHRRIPSVRHLRYGFVRDFSVLFEIAASRVSAIAAS